LEEIAAQAKRNIFYSLDDGDSHGDDEEDDDNLSPSDFSTNANGTVNLDAWEERIVLASATNRLNLELEITSNTWF